MCVCHDYCIWLSLARMKAVWLTFGVGKGFCRGSATWFCNGPLFFDLSLPKDLVCLLWLKKRERERDPLGFLSLHCRW